MRCISMTSGVLTLLMFQHHQIPTIQRSSTILHEWYTFLLNSDSFPIQANACIILNVTDPGIAYTRCFTLYVNSEGGICRTTSILWFDASSDCKFTPNSSSTLKSSGTGITHDIFIYLINNTASRFVHVRSNSNLNKRECECHITYDCSVSSRNRNDRPNHQNKR